MESYQFLRGEPDIYQVWNSVVCANMNMKRIPTVVEVGAHHGSDSLRLMHASPEGIRWIGFEPDPRNIKVMTSRGLKPVQAAVSDVNGETWLWLSSGTSPGSTREHTDSSSIRAPTRHIELFPWCTFENRTLVRTVRLDDAIPADEEIDLLWVDVQGAQRNVIAGGQAVLERTRLIYMECHQEPLYDGEPTFEELCGLLPGFDVLQRWPSDVLFVTKQLR